MRSEPPVAEQSKLKLLTTSARGTCQSFGTKIRNARAAGSSHFSASRSTRSDDVPTASMSLAVSGARRAAPAPSRLSSGSSPHRVGSAFARSARSRRRGERARVSASRASPSSSSTPKRAAKNPEDWGGDYDKIREDLMRRGPRWADNLPGISNSLNWLSENTFGAAKDLRDGVDVLAGWYRAFLDRLPYRRQDGRAARFPRGRAASAFKRGGFQSERRRRRRARPTAPPSAASRPCSRTSAPWKRSGRRTPRRRSEP